MYINFNLKLNGVIKNTPLQTGIRKMPHVCEACKAKIKEVVDLPTFGCLPRPKTLQGPNPKGVQREALGASLY